MSMLPASLLVAVHRLVWRTPRWSEPGDVVGETVGAVLGLDVELVSCA